jgi:hypothetical protein
VFDEMSAHERPTSQEPEAALTVSATHQTPGAILKFIPAGCTGKMQPLDVAVQKPMKEAVRMSFNAFASESLHIQLAAGTPAAECQVDFRLSALKEGKGCY